MDWWWSLDAVDWLRDNFLLFVDPQTKASYQVDLWLTGGGPQEIFGIDLPTSNEPSRVAYDYSRRTFYWHDNEAFGRNSVKRMSLIADVSEHSVFNLANGNSSSSSSSSNTHDPCIVLW